MFTKNTPKDDQKEKEELKWIPDHKHKKCMRCPKQFSMMNRRHHCRQCGCLICSDCSKNKWYIQSPHDNETKYERVCDSCFKALSNNKPVEMNSDPYLKILSEPNFYSWLMTFEKYWIRSMYPDKYTKYKQQLLTKNDDNNGNKNNKPKPTNANIVSKLTPAAVDKKIEENKQKKQQRKKLQKQKHIRKDSSGLDNSIDSINSSNSTGKKPKYQRQQKSKYQTSMEQEKNKTLTTQPIVPPMTKITKQKKYNPLIVVQTGLLYIRIMEALGLPDCDRFSQPDGYCIYYVKNNDPLFGETTKYSTKVHHNTYEPQWNEDDTIIITNTTGKLVIELWDYDFGADDDYLGRVEIELSDLYLHFSCEQKRHSVIDDWFVVKLAPEYQNQKDKEMAKFNRKRKTKSKFETNNNTEYKNPYCVKLLRDKYEQTSRVLQIPDDNDKYNSDNLRLTAVYKRLETMPVLSIDDTFHDDSVIGKCYIHLQLKLKATEWGHFISHFDPLIPPHTKKASFNVNIFYAEINKLWLWFIPIMDESYEIMDVIFWTKYIRASIYLLMYAYCVFNPWFAVFWFQLRLLIFICSSYADKTVLSAENSLDGSKKFNLPGILHWLVVCFGIIPTILKQIINKNKQLNDEEKLNNQIDNINSFDDIVAMQQQQQSKGKKDNIEQKEEKSENSEELTMGGFSTMMGNNIIRVSGMKENMCYYQELLIWINEMLEYILTLFDWTYVPITSMIVIILIISCLLLIIFKNTSFYQYEVLIIGCAILAYFSKPIQFIQWFMFGLSDWYYKYYYIHKKFKIEIKQSEEYDSDVDEEELNETSDLDHTIMGQNALFKKKNKNKNKSNDKYFWKLFNKLMKIIYFICELCLNLIFGLIEFIKPIFDTDKNNQKQLYKMKKKNDDLFVEKSDSEPTMHKNKSNKLQFDKPLLKPTYLSADALSTGSGRIVKSPIETHKILKQQKYGNESKSFIGNMFSKLNKLNDQKNKDKSFSLNNKKKKKKKKKNK